MLAPYGKDRVRQLPDESVELHSPIDKGWRGTRGRTSTTAEFPGTPVQWGDRWYEVTFVRRNADGSRVYVLRAWREEHPIRNPSRYDEESEQERIAELAGNEKRSRSTAAIALSALVIGHIPAHAQREIEREYGFSSVALSLLSLLLPFAFIVWVAAHLPIMQLPPPHATRPQLGLAMMLFGESTLRLILILRLSSPIGSVAGVIAYEIWRMTTRAGAAFEKRAAVKAEQRLRAKSLSEADAATLERDAYELRAPFLSLLAPAEQTRLRETYGFDPKASGLRSSIVIGIFSALGAWTSFVKLVYGEGTLWTWSSLFVALFLFGEQAWRLTRVLGGAPAGSVLGGLVRAWCRPLFTRTPTALKPGSVHAAPVDLPAVWDGDEIDDQNGR